MWNTEILGYKTTIRVDWLLNVCQNLIPNTLKERAKNIKSLPRNCPRVSGCCLSWNKYCLQIHLVWSQNPSNGGVDLWSSSHLQLWVITIKAQQMATQCSLSTAPRPSLCWTSRAQLRVHLAPFFTHNGASISTFVTVFWQFSETLAFISSCFNCSVSC